MNSAVLEAARARADDAILGAGAGADANDGRSMLGGSCVDGVALADGRTVDEEAAAAAA